MAIISLTPENTEEAVRLLARAFVTNPLHIAVFGKDRLAANEAFFRIGLSVMKGQKLVAVDGARILGVVHWVDSPRCQLSATEKLWYVPAMIKGFGARSAIRTGNWLSVWSKWDPPEHHCHLGPIAVSPEAQGRGIGRQLMERHCDQLDARGIAGYLETDRAGNVEFYKRFGYEVIGTTTIHGVLNYFMLRGPKTTG